MITACRGYCSDIENGRNAFIHIVNARVTVKQIILLHAPHVNICVDVANKEAATPADLCHQDESAHKDQLHRPAEEGLRFFPNLTHFFKKWCHGILLLINTNFWPRKCALYSTLSSQHTTDQPKVIYWYFVY
jgi:hypothetical protein